MEEEKLEDSLALSLLLPEDEREKSEDLSLGYEVESASWEVILRVAGSESLLEERFPTIDFRWLSGGYGIALVPERDLDALLKQEEVIYMEQPKRLYTQVLQGKRASCITPLQQEITPAGDLTGRGIFVAIIDSGIDYFHPDFRNDDGTSRIAWLYDDGTEYSKAQIDEALRRENRADAEELVPSGDFSGHGTHVAGIAAGNGRASDGRNRGIAYESQLIVVKLGNARRGGFPKTTQLMEGLEYVKNKAMEEGKPVAINISFGNNYGSHTGHSLVETYINQLANQWKMSIVIGSGNEGNGPYHKEGRLVKGEDYQLEENSSYDVNTRMRRTLDKAQQVEFVIGEYETAINLSMWKLFWDQFNIDLQMPDGRTFRLGEVVRDRRIDARGGEELDNQRNALGGEELDNQRDELGEEGLDNQSVHQGFEMFTWNATNIYVFYGNPSPYSSYQEIYLSFLPQTNYLDAGVYKLVLYPEKIKDGRFGIWFMTGALNSANTGFLEPSAEATLTIPSTAENVITVGAYDSRRNQYASFSGRGYTWASQQVKPDLVAPGVDILSCSVRGGYVSKSGTSMATPFVTGAAALMMEWGIVRGRDPFMYGEKLKAHLLLGAEGMTGEEMPSRRTGWGKLCLENALKDT